MNMYATGKKILEEGITMGEPNKWWVVRYKSREDKILFLDKNKEIKQDPEGNPVTSWLYCKESQVRDSEHVEVYVFATDQEDSKHETGYGFAADMLKRKY